MVNRIEMLSNLAGIGKFAVTLFRIPNRKCFNRLLSNFAHQGSDRAGINSAAEKNAERNVAHKVTADRLLEHLAVFGNAISACAFVPGARKIKVPVLFGLKIPLLIDFEPVTW